MILPANPGDLIRRARKKAGMGQVEFSKQELGVSQTLLSRYEKGRIESPPAWIIIHCANILLDDTQETSGRQEGPLAERLQRLAGEELRLSVREIIEALDRYAQSR